MIEEPRSSPGRRFARLMRGLLVDISPLKANSGFRWLFVGQLASHLGRQMLVVAVPFQVFILTESSLLVGMVGLVQILPLLGFSILGGTLADAFDRRRVLIGVQVFLVLTSVGLAWNAESQELLWPIYVLIALNAGLSGIDGPARTAIIPSMVARNELATAFALNQSLTQTLGVVGPAVAGLLIARYGIAAAYWLSAIAGVLTGLAAIPLGTRIPQGASGSVTLSATVEGWRYLRSKPLLQQIMIVDLNAMVFGMPRALFPVIGTVVLGGDAATVGLLHAAPGAGALVGALTTGWVGAVRRQGRIVVVAVCVWGIGIMGFGFSRNLTLALALLAIAGAADVVSNVFRAAILQMAVPDHLRGRLSAFKTAITGGGPRLGDAEAGVVAALTTPTVSVVSGGLIAALGTLVIAWRGRAIWNQSTDDLDELD